ncbi:MAG: ABC transporter ATP-binding protein [Candidatus Hodarchaeales archaeon]|jgi:simple sugar transport system ATP-binding protein
MFDIVKKFPGVIANDHISLEIKRGEIHALLGENGAGKTTLMNILYGLYGPDEEGRILINNEEVVINEPIDAMRLGIGMVHQHFMLIPVMSVAENIVLGVEPVINGIRLNEKEMKDIVLQLSMEHQVDIDPDTKIENLPVGTQQRVEILKILYRKADILIFDEPTAVLTPQEVTILFKTLRNLQQHGKTIIIITHKLKEPMALADRITVLRKGKVMGTVNREDTSPEILAEMMVGRKLLKMEKEVHTLGKKILEINNLVVEGERGKIAVDGVSFNLSEGEIIGIAGVVGNGQNELAEAIAGLNPIISGNIVLSGEDITNFSTKEIYDQGLAYIPEDRRKTGTVKEFDITENLMLGLQHRKKWYRKGILSFLMDLATINSSGNELIEQYDIRTPSIFTKLGSLSGGNQQKVVVARELSKNPSVVLASQPTRGLDVGVIEYVHKRLIELRKDNKGILLISSDIDEILTLSDRIAVMYEGKIISFEDPNTTTDQRLGLLMAGHTNTN